MRTEHNKAKQKKKNDSELSKKGKRIYRLILLLAAVAAAVFLLVASEAEMFPKTFVGIFAVAAVLLLLLDFVFVSRKKRPLRIIGIFLIILTVGIFGLGTYYVAATQAMFNNIATASTDSNAPAKAVSVTEEPFNIYITGIDQWESEKGEDLERSDVNMIITVNPKSRKILLTSIPRDSYVALHRTGEMDKLTHTGIYGVDETLNTVEDWLGIDLNYYVKTNFSGVRDVIDAMGGVDVYSPVAFDSSISDYSYVKGWNHLTGKAALYFARERKAFEGKDDIRVENQQRVVEAILDKMFSSSTLLIKYADIIEAAGSSVETNMSSDEMQSLIKMQIADLEEWDIETQKIEGEYGMDYVASMSRTQQYSVYYTDDSSVKKCLAAIDDVMNPTADEIAEAELKRQKNSIGNFIRGIFAGDDESSDES